MTPAFIGLLAIVVCAQFSGVALAAEIHLRQSKAGYYKAETRLPSLETMGPLQSLATATCLQWAKKSQQDFIRESKQTFRDLGKPREAYEYTATGKIQYHTPRLLSVLFETWQYTGGAHGNSFSKAFTFGLVDGKAKVMKLADFFTPGSDYKQRVSDAVIAKLKKNKNATEVTEGNVKKLTAQQLEHFVVVPDGLKFLFDPYEVGPYAAGSFEVKLTADELGPHFRKMLIFARTSVQWREPVPFSRSARRIAP